MRRLLSVAALLTLGWSQAVALQCPLGTNADHGLTAAHEAASPPHAAAHALSKNGGGPASGEAPCHLAMTCAWAMVDASESAATLQLATTLHEASGRLRAPHAAADLLAEPPPPRLQA